MRTVPSWIALLASAALCAAEPVRAEIYKWVDGDGDIHFTTDLSKVPAGQRSGAEEGARERERSSVIQRHSSSPVAVPARRAPGRSARAGQKTYTIPIPPGGVNLPVMVQLNDRVMAPFIIDTGASDVAIPRSVAEQLGIEIGPDTLTKRYRTANGVIDAAVVTLDSVSLGGARVEDVQASVSDSLPTGLLGLSYFNHFHYQVDSARGLVHLTPNGLTGSDAMRGGRTQAQWRGLFANLRGQLRTIQDEIERTPRSRSRKLDRLGDQRKTVLDQLARVEAEADQLRVPFSWRD